MNVIAITIPRDSLCLISRPAEPMAYSISGRVGHVLELLSRPNGFDWRRTTACIVTLVSFPPGSLLGIGTSLIG